MTSNTYASTCHSIKIRGFCDCDRNSTYFSTLTTTMGDCLAQTQELRIRCQQLPKCLHDLQIFILSASSLLTALGPWLFELCDPETKRLSSSITNLNVLIRLIYYSKQNNSLWLVVKWYHIPPHEWISHCSYLKHKSWFISDPIALYQTLSSKPKISLRLH